LDIKKPERLIFIGLSGLYWFSLNLCIGADGETRTLTA
jgi:hypothetical protein